MCFFQTPKYFSFEIKYAIICIIINQRGKINEKNTLF